MTRRGCVNAAIGSVKWICESMNSIVDRGLGECRLRLGRRPRHVLRIIGWPRRQNADVLWRAWWGHKGLARGIRRGVARS